jgi:hypothetical protein
LTPLALITPHESTWFRDLAITKVLPMGFDT